MNGRSYLINSLVKNIKSILSLVFFIIFIVIGCYIFISRYELTKKAMNIAEQYSNNFNDTNESVETIEYLSDYDRDHHNVIDNISKLYKGVEIFDEQLSKYIMDMRKNGNADNYYNDNKSYILNLLKDTRIIGDSMIFYIAVNRVLGYENISVLKGVSVKKQYDVIEHQLKGNESRVILWNGYHIKYFDSAKDYVTAYKNLIDKIHEKAPNCKVYICSLIPASKHAIEKDIDSGFSYEIYKGPEFDAALRENFKDEYININDFFTSEDLYYSDGVHPSSTAYRMIVPYLAFYINSEHNGDDKNISLYQNQYYESGLLNENNIKENVELSDDDQRLFEEYEKYRTAVSKKPGITYYEENKEYIKFLCKDTCFVGDSNVLKLLTLKLIKGQNVVSFGASRLEEFIEKMEDESRIDVKNFKNIVFWNGYNIKYIENSEHLISDYNKLIDRIHEKNPDCKVYICSLLPAKKEKIEEDLAAGAPHNIYKGMEYDNALKDYFKDNYINTKFFINGEWDYTADGFHLQNDFYKRMIPYVGFYVNFMELKANQLSAAKEGEDNSKKTMTLFDLPDNANDDEYNKLLAELKEEVLKNHNCVNFYKRNKKYIEKLLENTKFVGDSNAHQLTRLSVLPYEYVGEMRGKSLTEQIKIVQNVLDGNEKNIVLWNGYNIKYFKSSKEYIEAYEELIKKIKTISKDSNIYICSLLPAKKSRVEEDFKSDFVHNIYLGPEYDSELEKHFEDTYIDTKHFLYSEDFYQIDEVHLNSTYMQMLVSYVAFYINNDIVKNK